jgi:hypothetical protein
MEWEWVDDVSTIGIAGPGIAGMVAAVAFLLLLFGGLPLAVFGLLLERQWAGVPIERRRLALGRLSRHANSGEHCCHSCVAASPRERACA